MLWTPVEQAAGQEVAVDCSAGVTRQNEEAAVSMAIRAEAWVVVVGVSVTAVVVLGEESGVATRSENVGPEKLQVLNISVMGWLQAAVVEWSEIGASN